MFKHAAVVPMHACGAGESNSGNPTQYAQCFPAMISQWRDDFNNKTLGASGPDLPFVFVQVQGAGSWVLGAWCWVLGAGCTRGCGVAVACAL